MEKPWLHRYAILLAVCTLLLVAAGASVTSKQAGLSVPDWPLSYGKVMPEMKGGVFYEHGHRMIATLVGFLTVIMAIWLWRVEDRRWMRNLGLAALAAVIVQGVLGGMTVKYMLPKPVSISHACLAQLFFSTTVAIAIFTSPSWKRGPVDRGRFRLAFYAGLWHFRLRYLVLVQLALGAGYRHRAFTVYAAHRIGAIFVTGFLITVAVFRPGAVRFASNTYPDRLDADGNHRGASGPRYRRLYLPGPLAGKPLCPAAIHCLADHVPRSHGRINHGLCGGSRHSGSPQRPPAREAGCTVFRRSLNADRLYPAHQTANHMADFDEHRSGIFLRRGGWLDLERPAPTLLGTAFIASGTAALNQWWERDADKKMVRTQDRPLPAERLHPTRALIFAIVLSIIGFVELSLGANLLTGLLGLFTLASYLFVYTPLKQRTPHSTTLGAIPARCRRSSASLPPTARSPLRAGRCSPSCSCGSSHTSTQSPGCIKTTIPTRVSRCCRSWTKRRFHHPPDSLLFLALIPVSLLPRYLGMSGNIYIGALALGCFYFYSGVVAARELNRNHARRVLLASIVYLPVLYGLMMADRSSL